jgi:hypothetical protein
MAPRIVFSASILAGRPVSKCRSGIVAIEDEFRVKAGCEEDRRIWKSGKRAKKIKPDPDVKSCYSHKT